MAQGRPLKGAALTKHNQRLEREIETLKSQTGKPGPTVHHAPSEQPKPAGQETQPHACSYVLLDPRRSKRMERAYRVGYRQVCQDCGELR